MKKYNRVFLIFAVFVLGACSGNGRRYSKVEVCPKNFSPLNVSDENSNYSGKLSLKPGEPLNIAEADYAYRSSQYFYYDSQNDIKIHLTHLSNSENDKLSINCVGGEGITANMQPIEFEIPVVTDLKISADGSSQIRTRLVRFYWKLGIAPQEKTVIDKTIDIIDESYIPGEPFVSSPNYDTSEAYFMTMKHQKNRYRLIHHLGKSTTDKLGKPYIGELRSSISLAPITEEQRKERDEKSQIAREKNDMENKDETSADL